MKRIKVRHHVGIPLHDVIATSALTFNKWFPANEDDKLIFIEDNIKVEIWFDRSCLLWVHEGDDNLEKIGNVLCVKSFVDVTVNNVPEGLAKFLQISKQEREKGFEELINDSVRLAEEVYKVCIICMNKVIKYCKNVKNQYWLEELPYNPKRIKTFNIDTNAKAIIIEGENNKWFLWDPNVPESIEINLPDKNRYLSKDDWEDLKKYLHEDRRVNFSLELISRANLLIGYGYKNNAIVDVVIALEIALFKFGSFPKLEKLNCNEIYSRIDSTLYKTFDKLGFTASIKYLLPIILPESTFEDSILNDVNRLIELRQNIIHNGQKEVKQEDLKLIKSAERLIKILINLTDKS